MIEYLPLILMSGMLLHVILMRKINHARNPYRMAIAGRFHELKKAGAPDWLLDFWMLVMGEACFSNGQLKWAILVSMFAPKSLRRRVLSIKHQVNRLPSEIREIHDHMDRDCAILLLLSSPYFSVLLISLTLIHRGTIELTRIVPARDARGELVLRRKLV